MGSIVKEHKSDADPTDSDDEGATQSKAKRFQDGPTYEKRSRLSRRDDGLVNSHKIDKEMVLISVPGEKKIDDFEDFVYDKSAGTGVNVYMVDTGAGLSNNDVSLIACKSDNTDQRS